MSILRSGLVNLNRKSVPEKSRNGKIRKNRKTGLKGFEPLTCGLRVRRYAELSYRPKPVRPNNVVDNAE